MRAWLPSPTTAVHAKDCATSPGAARACGAPFYLAAFNACRAHSILKAFYQRLRTAGKPFKVALIATAGKLLTTLNLLVQNPRFIPRF